MVVMGGPHFLLNKTANKAPASPETQRPESWSGSTQAPGQIQRILHAGKPKGHDARAHRKGRNKRTLAVRRSCFCSSVWSRAGVASSRCRDRQRSDSSSGHSEPQPLASKLLKTSFRRSSYWSCSWASSIPQDSTLPWENRKRKIKLSFTFQQMQSFRVRVFGLHTYPETNIFIGLTHVPEIRQIFVIQQL